MRRRAGVVGVVGLVALAAAASVAWACTAISAVYSINPSAAPAGSEVVVTGRDFWPQAIEIRWDSVDGPVIGTTRGPDFDAPVRIPADAIGGHHRVFATQEGSRNPHISFEVLAPHSAGPSDDPDQGSTSLGGPDPGQAAETPWVHQAPAESAAQPTSGSSPGPGGSGSSSSGPGGSRGGPSGPSSPPRPGAGGPSANSPAHSSPPPAALAAPVSPDTAELAQPAAASKRSASGDVSFASPWPAATEAGTSLSHPRPSPGPANSAGVVLLALGLAGLAGATTVGLRRRTPVPATSHQADSL